MAINKNHEFDDLDGVKCAIVEKNVGPQRVEFLKKLLEFNGYTTVVVPSPPPKAAPASPAAASATPAISTEPIPVTEIPIPTTFTLGVTDVVFNATNAIFGRLLHTPDGHVVTLAYWNQKESASKDDIPYYEKAE